MGNSLIIRDAVKEQWSREALLAREFHFPTDHSAEAIAAWAVADTAPNGGILLCNSNADWFAYGYDAAVAAMKENA